MAAQIVSTNISSGFRPGASQSSFAVTNWVEDLALVCTTDDAALGNVLGTLIKTLIENGIINGSVDS
jgi:hypothetical protein